MRVGSLTVKARGRTILDAVSFTASDEVLGVAGPNGSGKSTLLRAIESAAWKRRQEVDLTGGIGRAHPSVAYLPQDFALPRELSVKQFIEYAAWLKNVPAAKSRAEAAMRSTHLTEFADRRLSRVSGGVAQRTGFASVLVDSPAVMLLDEPTTGVDVQQREIMRRIIADQSRGRVTILSSHIAEDLERLCDRVLILRQGRVRFLGTIDEARAATGASTFSDALLTLSGGSP